MTDIVFKAKGGVEYYAGDAPEAVLKWYAKEARNPALREAAQAELVARASGPEDLERKAIETEGTEAPEPPSKPRPQAQPPKPPTQPKPNAALAKLDDVRGLIATPFHQLEQANAALSRITEVCHLVSPEPNIRSIPEGFELGVALVNVDAERETYYVGGKTPAALDRVALQRVGSAAGVTWIFSRAIDNLQDPHYCEWQSIARVRMLDGQMRDIPGTVTIDLREDIGPDWKQIVDDAANATGRDGRPAPRDPSSQLLTARKFIRRMAESKAMNRAIGNMGVRRSYTKAELQNKPFAVVRLIFTGRTEDPELRREFAKMRAQSFLQGAAAAWGPEPLPALAPSAEPIPPELQGPTDEELPE